MSRLGPWSEVGERIYVRRYADPFDHNVGLILGEAGALVVDTRCNPAQARVLHEEIRQISQLPVGWVFNTHEHWDHVFGNQEFTEARIWGHLECRRRLVDNGKETRTRVMGYYPDDPAYADVAVTPPTDTFTDRASIDLGDRPVELAFYGLGHTSNDAVIHVDGVTFAGDLVEEGSAPSFDDSFPIAWVETIGLLAEAARPVVVPGHGAPVEPDYLAMSRFDLAWIVRTAKAGADRGQSAEEVSLDGSPYPEEPARIALSRAYSELKFSQ